MADTVPQSGKRVIVLAGGIIESMEFLRRTIEEMENTVVICADGGCRHLRLIDVVPSMIVGDMDSVLTETLDHFVKKGARVKVSRAEKDETDTELALKEAIALQPSEILILGALGARFDHAVANLHLLVMGDRSGIRTKIVDENCEIFIVSDEWEISGAKGETVSLFSFSSTVRGITLAGFEYPLVKGVMEVGVPCGVSNRLAEDRGLIAVDSGYLLVIRQFHL
ncbi:MAG: thiamine diphosphokinase [Deltaproteobacteria bacterium]|nr:thiamine diphosphokinase [Deltaproteobacteria bacterium]